MFKRKSPERSEIKLRPLGYGKSLTSAEMSALGEAALRSEYFANNAPEAIKKELTDKQAQDIKQSLNPDQQLIFDAIQERHLIYKTSNTPSYELAAAIGLEGKFEGRSNPDIYVVLRAIMDLRSEQ